jgi:hypothetical protein
LKESAADGNGVEYAHVLRELFDLDSQAEPEPTNIGEVPPEPDTRKTTSAAAN